MSWSFWAVVTAGAGFADREAALEAAMLEAQQQAGEWGPETRHQTQAAVNAALQLVASGALGAGPVAVSMTGHANPGHSADRTGEPDSVTIYVHRAETADPL